MALSFDQAFSLRLIYQRKSALRLYAHFSQIGILIPLKHTARSNETVLAFFMMICPRNTKFELSHIVLRSRAGACSRRNKRHKKSGGRQAPAIRILVLFVRKIGRANAEPTKKSLLLIAMIKTGRCEHRSSADCSRRDKRQG
ncbi:MAG: hypothetical protein ACI3XO_06775 [Eubacteriales bacterium]